MRRLRTLMILCSCVFPALAFGGTEATPGKMKTVIEHRGGTNPTDEDRRFSNTRIRVGDGVETIGDRQFPYWAISDSGGEDGYYEFSLIRAQMALPWRMTLAARVVDVSMNGTGFGLTLLDGVT